jgi:hypothetical protein
VDRVVLESLLSVGRGKVSFQPLLRLELSEVATRRTEASPPKVAFILDSARELGWSVWDRSIRSTVNVQCFLAMALRQLSCTGLQRHLRHQRGWCPDNIACRRASGVADSRSGPRNFRPVCYLGGRHHRWYVSTGGLGATGYMVMVRIFAALLIAGFAMTWQAYAQRRMAALGARGSSVKA